MTTSTTTPVTPSLGTVSMVASTSGAVAGGTTPSGK